MLSTTATRSRHPKPNRGIRSVDGYGYRLVTNKHGEQTMVPIVVRSRKYRATRAVVKAGWRLSKKTWARRRPLAPMLAALPLFVLAEIAHHTQYGNRSILSMAGLLALFIGGYELVARKGPTWLPLSPRPIRRAEWMYIGGIGLATTTWLYLAAVYGMTPRRAVWFLILLGAAEIPAAVRFRIRHDRDDALPEMTQLWKEHASPSDGIAPGTDMTEVGPLDPKDPSLATSGLVELPRSGKIKVGTVIAETERIAMMYDREVGDVAIERVPGRSRFVKVTAFNRNPLRDKTWWPGPQAFDPATGVAKIGPYLTGGQARYRFYGDAGPVHDIIAGVTGSGKSAFINSLLAIERSSPMMASIVIDPQWGQSLPRWVDNTAHYARGVDAGRETLLAVVDMMFERNRLLSEVKWTDKFGHLVKGIESFDPRSGVIRELNLPLACITIEEAAMQLEDPVSYECVIRIATMIRKCGGKLRLVFQTPLLEQVKSQIIRDQINGGNSVTFRTGSPISGGVVLNGRLPASPHLLPDEWEDGSTASGVFYIIGPQAKPVMARTQPIEDTYHWATVGETTMLPDFTAALERVRDEYGAVGVKPETEVITVTGAKSAAAGLRSGRLPARILTYIAEHPGKVTTNVLSTALGNPVASSLSTALGRLAEKGLINDYGDGLWGSLDAPEALADEASSEVAA